MPTNLIQQSGLAISGDPTQQEIGIVRAGLAAFHHEQTGGAYGEPGVEFGLVLRDGGDRVVGGIEVCTTLRVMHLDLLWVAGEWRGLGYGRDLVLSAEGIGRGKGCIASQTMSFSFQAPGFYQKIGYKVLGVYDGYPDGITEYVLLKSLGPEDGPGDEAVRSRRRRDFGSLKIVQPQGPSELEQVHAGLRDYVRAHVGDKEKASGIRLVLKDGIGEVTGGLIAYTTLGNLVIEELWLEDSYRGRGLGRALVLEAERRAAEQGCIACQTYTFSYAAPEFFRKLGYRSFAVSDGYPDPFQEHYLIKRFST